MSEKHFSIENAKSGRAACKKCKEKITKGEFRIGLHGPGPGDYEITMWYHKKCFVIPKNMKGVTVETFVKEMLKDETDDLVLTSSPSFSESLIDQITDNKKRVTKSKVEPDNSTSASVTTNSSSTDATDAKICKLKKIMQQNRKHQEEKNEDDFERSPKKRRINENSLHGDKSEIDEAKVMEMYEKNNVDELKDVLRWNRQLLKGNKNVLLLRIIDGSIHGRLGICPNCIKGKLKLKDEDGGQTVYCNGYYDKDSLSRIKCFYECPAHEAPRLKWFTEKPTEDEDKEIDASFNKNQDGIKDDGDTSAFSELVDSAQAIDDGGEWDLTTKKGITNAAETMHKLCTDKNQKCQVDVPANPKKAKMEIGKLLLLHKPISASDFVVVLKDKFKLASENDESERRKAKVASNVCATASNAPVFLAIAELGELYFKEKNTNAGITYKKVAAAIKDLDFEITADNAKGLGKGKTKVPGIGKSSADKIYEFVSTGKMEKLEEKRASLN